MEESSTKTVAEAERDGRNLYNWSYRAGRSIICSALERFGERQARNYLLRIIKELRTEASPERFRSKFVSSLAEAFSDLEIPMSFPRILKSDARLSLDEFHRLSSIILMGLWDAFASFASAPNLNEFCKGKEEGGE